MECTFCNSIRLYEYHERDKVESWKIPNERRQQRLVRTVKKFLTTTASSSTVGPITGQSVSPAARVMQKRNVKSPGFTHNPEITAVGSDGNKDENTLAVKQPQKRRRKVYRHGAVQQNAKLVSATTPTEGVNLHVNTVSRPTFTTGAFEDSQRNILSTGFTSEAPYEDRVSLVWVRNARRSTNFRVARMKKSHSSLSAFLQAAMIPAHHRAYVFLSVGDVQTSRRIA